MYTPVAKFQREIERVKSKRISQKLMVISHERWSTTRVAE